VKNGPNELWFRHVIFFLEGLSENIIKLAEHGPVGP
jgi:hypothetical protein